MKRIKLFLIACMTMFAIFTQVEPVRAFAAMNIDYWIYSQFYCAGPAIAFAVDEGHAWDVCWEVRGKSFRNVSIPGPCINTNWPY
jgi:hypothetical protein